MEDSDVLMRDINDDGLKPMDAMAGEGGFTELTPTTRGQLDAWIARLTECQPLSEDDVNELCNMAKGVLQKEENVQPVHAPVTICGDTQTTCLWATTWTEATTRWKPCPIWWP
ncbi:Serine/threonine-protein phosphatase PP2A-2 catalytic subunit [Yarrowia sp. C11]|nr:Serine/threonine-protein phosphatase PP2A-2 catalytic subunit [Yarrowia sp. C11]